NSRVVTRQVARPDLFLRQRLKVMCVLALEVSKMAWDWAAIGAVVGGVSTAVVALLTWVLIQENRLIRKAGNSPRIVASFEPHPEGNRALKLALSNVGTGPALDVSYSFEYEDGDFENYDLLLKYAVSRPAITMIAQGEKFS